MRRNISRNTRGGSLFILQVILNPSLGMRMGPLTNPTFARKGRSKGPWHPIPPADPRVKTPLDFSWKEATMILEGEDGRMMGPKPWRFSFWFPCALLAVESLVSHSNMEVDDSRDAHGVSLSKGQRKSHTKAELAAVRSGLATYRWTSPT